MTTILTAYRYHFKIGNKIVHTGITGDLYRRGVEYRKEFSWGKGHIKQVGYRTTVNEALEWKRKEHKKRNPSSWKNEPLWRSLGNHCQRGHPESQADEARLGSFNQTTMRKF